MLDPSLLASTPHKSGTAFLDLVGTVSLMHSTLIEATIRTTGNVPRRVTIDAAEPQEDLLQAIHDQQASLAQALGLGPPTDLRSFDLTDPNDFASWTFLLAADLTRLRNAAGVV